MGAVRWASRFLATREGIAIITGALGASLALGMLPDLLKVLPGPELLWLVLFAVAGVLLVMASTYLLHHRDGVGIVLWIGNSGDADWDRTRLQLMERDARSKHATCFTVNVDELLGGQHIEDRAKFAFRVMQARLQEGTGVGTGVGVTESASFYVTARHADAFALGQLLKYQVHDDVDAYAEEPERVHGTVMGLSEERGRSVFPAVGLDSGLLRPTSAQDRRLLDGVLTGDPARHEFEGPGGTSNRFALVLQVSGKPMREGALRAAREGTGGDYAFPGGRPAQQNRCGGALVIETGHGNIPDRREVYEALIHHVGEHWREALDRWGTERGSAAQGVLFTDAPATVVLALGSVLGRNTVLVPHAPGPAALVSGQGQGQPGQGSGQASG